jgi:hypothetical protein
MVVVGEPPVRASEESPEPRFSSTFKDSDVDDHATVKGWDVHKPRHGM